jgi:hypothetical protein
LVERNLVEYIPKNPDFGTKDFDRKEFCRKDFGRKDFGTKEYGGIHLRKSRLW